MHYGHTFLSTLKFRDIAAFERMPVHGETWTACGKMTKSDFDNTTYVTTHGVTGNATTPHA